MVFASISRWFAIVILLAAPHSGWARADDAPVHPSVGQQPGAVAYPPELSSKISSALSSRPDDYSPRTHHLTEEKEPKYTNRLFLEGSPYLIQHAHNPVNWHPWGDEAFSEAKRLGRPILLSSGYSTCHWCHVMERESFEDLEIAEYINQNFVPIKLDRERRPDVDSIYMTAVRMMTRRGGWPMTIVMTPEGEPFFGGTYFPARDGDRGARRGFFTILKDLSRSYQSDPDQIVARARQISEAIREQARRIRPAGIPGAEALRAAFAFHDGTFDPVHGGFGKSPKFPRPVTLEFLTRYYRRTKNLQALHIVTHTLDKMADGGMYDQVGGGFHRYSVDARWLVPHFEKMLYDNAQLIQVYLDAYQITREPKAARIAGEILDYALREMRSPWHAFYSATDADSLNPQGHDEEGWFFTWTPNEIQAVLEPDEARLIQLYHRVTPQGNFEGRTILHVVQRDEDIAKRLGLTSPVFRQKLKSCHKKLYAHRQKRPAPLRDDKVLASWNGLMIGALARGGSILDRRDYTRAAEAAADFVLRRMKSAEGRLQRVFLDEQVSHEAVLNDYAFLISGLLDLFEASQRPRWLREAIRLQSELDKHFWDTKEGGYFLASDTQVSLLVREKPSYDGAVPGGNSYAAMNLLRLHTLTFEKSYREKAEQIFRAFSSVLSQGRGIPRLACALDYYLDRVPEIVIVKPTPDAEASPFLQVLAQTYVPHKAVVVVAEGPALQLLQKTIPYLEGKVSRDGKTTAYVCEEGVCQLPTTDPEEFAKQIAEPAPYPEANSEPPGPSKKTND